VFLIVEQLALIVIYVTLSSKKSFKML